MTSAIPQNVEAEASLLGAMLLSRKACADALDIVTPADFYKPNHGVIFDAIRSLYERASAVDSVTVADELERTNMLATVGGLTALLDLQGNTPATSNAAHYAGLVERDAVRRRLIGVAGDIAAAARDHQGDAAEAVEDAERLLRDLADGRRGGREAQHLGDSLAGWLDRMEARCALDTLEGVATGWIDLDAILAGLRPGQLVTVAARPAMGKSVFASNLTIEAGRFGHPVLAVSLEMSLPELQDRIVSASAQIPLESVRKGTISERDWARIATTGIPNLAELPVWVEDDPNITVAGIRSSARRVAQKAGRIGLIVVDYVQLVRSAGRAENRQVEVAEISRDLKKLALELQTPVVSLAQLNRKVEERADKRPMLADLRDSGAIEQDSDVVLFLYRDEVYHPDTRDPGVAEVIVAKQRSGPTGTVRLSFDARFGRFRNLASM